MRKNLFTAMALLLLLSGSQYAPAQNATRKGIIQITETDENGHVVELGAAYKVIDPNSILDIRLSKDKLYEAVGSYTVDASVTEKIRKLKQMVLAEAEALKALTRAIDKYRAGDSTYKIELGSLGQFTQLVLDDPEGSTTYMAINGGTANRWLQYKNLFVTASVMVQRLEKQIIDSSTAKGIYLQMGAFLDGKKGTTPVHLDGFDNYDPAAPFKVDRFSVLLTDEQKKEIEEMASAAKLANSEGIVEAIAAQSSFRKLVATVLASGSFKAADDLKTTLQNIADRWGNDAADVKAMIEDLRAYLESYTSYIKSYVTKYNTPVTRNDAAALLLEVNTDIGNFKQRTHDVVMTIQTKVPLIIARVNAIPAALQNDVRTVTTALDTLGTAINADLDKLKQDATAMIGNLIEGNQFNNRVYEFSDKVKKIALNYLPLQTTLNLELAGKREQGDVITFRLVRGDAKSAAEQIDLVRYYLYFCGTYAETATGFLFTDPVPFFKPTANKSLFHYAPSYSILLKGFWKGPKASRKKLAYHRLFSPGLGVNVASLDFNSDGAMEIGVAGVFTIFRNYIQLGSGVNTFNGDGYYFFGVRLPVGNFSLK